MKPLKLLGALLVGGLVGCANAPPPTSPVEDPGLPEPEVVEPEPAEAEPTEAEPAEPEPTEPEAPPPVEEPVGRPTCEQLKKGTCKVTQGCAWRENAGKGECIPHGSDL